MRQLVISFFILTLIYGCEKSVPNVEECPMLSEWKIVDQEEAFLTCEHYEIYELNNQLYAVCSNCEVDKLAFPISCEGEQFCPFEPDDLDMDAISQCLTEFYKEAEFRFYMIES